jgi:hypothetical protein
MGDIVESVTSPITSIFGGNDAPVPTPPNPADTIAAQQRATQLFQITPQGTLEYGTIDEEGNFVPRPNAEGVRITESPFQQQFRTESEQLALQLLGQVSGQDLGDFRTAAQIEAGLQVPLLGDFADDALRIEQETFEAGQRRLAPIIEQERRDLVQNLADRGIPLSSEAAQKELNRFDQSVGDRQQDLAFGAIEAGRVEQNRLASLTSALRGQEVNEQLALANLEQQQRAQQFGEVGALGGFAAPFQPFNAPTVDVASIINQGFANQLGASQFQQQQANQQMQFIGDIGAATLGAAGAAGGFGNLFSSDYRLKENIKHVGNEKGYNLYHYNYIGNPTRFKGVMAQEVMKSTPEAVTVMENGYYGVYYDKLGLQMEVVDER